MPDTGVYEGFTQPLGRISVGSGKQVLPAPEIPSGYNVLTRSPHELSFSWQNLQANPVGYDETNSGVIPIPLEQADSFILEITPDLGWPNQEQMFELPTTSDVRIGNAMMRRITNLRIGTDITEETISNSPAYHKLTYSMPKAEFVKVVNTNYKAYLWRILAVRDDGIESFPSIIQRFAGRISVANLDWTLESPKGLTGLTVSLGGNKTPSINRIEIDGYTGYATMDSATRWSAEIPIRDTGQEFFVRAIDSSDNTSALKKTTLSLPSDKQVYQSTWNTLDELGMMVDLDRLPTENNTGYKTRIIDVYKHRGGPRYKGLINGTSRELGVSYDDAGLTLNPGVNIDTKNDIAGVHITVGSKYIYVDADVYQITREHHNLDSWDWSITLNNEAIDDVLVIESPIGTEIKSRNTWTLSDNKIVFKDNLLEGQSIYATYRYHNKYSMIGNTVKAAGDWLTSLTHQGSSILEVSTGSTIDTGSPATYLAITPRTEIVRNLYKDFGNNVHTGFPMRWDNSSIRLISDDEFSDSKINQYNNHFGTKMDEWATLLRSQIHTQWGFLIADRNVWSEKDKPQSGRTFLPTTYDPHFSHWESSSPLVPIRYSHLQARAYNYLAPTDGSDMQYKGISSSMFRSGIGYGTDLLVRTVSSTALQVATASTAIPFSIKITHSQLVGDGGDTTTVITGALPADGILEI